ncbi:MAG: hypothetical protein EBU01_11940, partial [Crocinitomicaceae bacterium]|nr:hypothetical protein [Crocinitomicaceae bacterium]
MVPLDAQVGDNLSLVATTYYGGDSNGLSVSVIEHLPTITGFSASTIRPGQLFTIYGKWFTGLTSIVYCAKLGCVTGPTSELEGQGVSISDTAITVRAPINVPSGQIRITTVNGFNYSPSAISVYPTPKITATKVGGKASTTAQRGATVSLTGTTFRAASVTFGAATAQVAVSASPAPSDTTMSVVVPANATPGSVVDLVVTSQNGVTSAPVAFTIGYDSPTVSSMSTSAAKIGALLTINGTELTEITSVKFGLNKLADLTDPAFANSNTAVTVKVPTGAVTGPITLTARGGSVTTSSFTVYQAPTIASVTPAIAKAGTVVTVSGTNLTGTSFTIGGVVAGPAPSFTATATSAKIVVPAGATASSVVGDSSVGVTSDGGSTSKAFTVVAAPSITSLGSNSVVVGNELTINGSYLANPSASPSPAAVTAKVGTVVAVVKPGASASQLVITVPLTAVVGNNTVSVTTAGGTVNQNVTIVPLAPSITSLSVASQNRGLTVRITGTNLGTPTVTVGGVAATVSAGATATSATVTIPATAPLGAQSLVLTTAGGSDNESINVLTNLPTVTNVSQTGTKRGVGTVTVTGEFFAGATVKVGTVN